MTATMHAAFAPAGDKLVLTKMPRTAPGPEAHPYASGHDPRYDPRYGHGYGHKPYGKRRKSWLEDIFD